MTTPRRGTMEGVDADAKLDRIRQVAKEGRVRMRSPDEALTEIETIIADEESPPPEVLSEPAIAADLRSAA